MKAKALYLHNTDTAPVNTFTDSSNLLVPVIRLRNKTKPSEKIHDRESITISLVTYDNKAMRPKNIFAKLKMNACLLMGCR